MMLSSDDGDKKQKKKLHVSKLSVVLIIICLLAIGTGAYFYMKYQTASNEKSANAKIVDRIARSVQLPNEAPVFITVMDKEKLSNKQLAAKVSNGDIMLIFANAKRLVVYRPSTEKVADMLGFSNEKDTR